LTHGASSSLIKRIGNSQSTGHGVIIIILCDDDALMRTGSITIFSKSKLKVQKVSVLRKTVIVIVRTLCVKRQETVCSD